MLRQKEMVFEFTVKIILIVAKYGKSCKICKNYQLNRLYYTIRKFK